MAKIIFQTICSNCNKPINEKIEVGIEMYYGSENKRIKHEIKITPNVCPNCNAEIDAIKVKQTDYEAMISYYSELDFLRKYGR